MAKPFTDKQIKQLRENPYTLKVTNSKIFFTKEFKQEFHKKRLEGLSLKETMRALGYDPDILGENRIDGISHLINKALREGREFSEGVTPRTSILDESCPEVTRENFIKMQHELQYMRQEIEFLKKISSQKTSKK